MFVAYRMVGEPCEMLPLAPIYDRQVWPPRIIPANILLRDHFSLDVGTCGIIDRVKH